MKWKIIELSLFGSALGKNFRPESDIDLLISFDESAKWSLFDWPEMTEELEIIFEHKVDVVEKEGLRNPFRRYSILSSRKVLYAA